MASLTIFLGNLLLVIAIRQCACASPAPVEDWTVTRLTPDGRFTGLDLDDQENLYTAYNAGYLILEKYTSAGALVWSRTYGFMRPVDVKRAPDGSLYVCGDSVGPPAVLAKFDQTGTFLWSVTLYADVAGTLSVSPWGTVYVGGDENFSANRSLWVSKVDGMGQVVWTRTFDGGGSVLDFGGQIILDAAENAYLVGSSPGGAVCVKYSPGGDLVWSRTYDGELANGAVFEPSGRLLIVGWRAPSSVDWEMWWTEVDPDTGDPYWSRSLTGSIWQDGLEVAFLDGGGSVLVCGFVGRHDLGQALDFWMAKFDPWLEQFVWQLEWNNDAGNGIELAGGGKVGKSGAIYVAIRTETFYGGFRYGLLRKYVYRAPPAAPPPPGLPPLVSAYPNPCSISAGHRVRFASRDPLRSVTIRTLSGEAVVTLAGEALAAGWDGRAGDGTRVAPGIYVFVAVGDQGQRSVGKFLVER